MLQVLSISCHNLSSVFGQNLGNCCSVLGLSVTDFLAVTSPCDVCTTAVIKELACIRDGISTAPLDQEEAAMFMDFLAPHELFFSHLIIL